MTEITLEKKYYSGEAVVQMLLENGMGLAGPKLTKILLERLAALPAADIRELSAVYVTERNVGKWIWQGSISEGCWVCSECNHRFYQGYGNENFCPNCGADMREEDTNAQLD